MENTETVLVTGGTGFVGMHIILQLLQQGYPVRTTVRSLNSKTKLIDTLKAQGITNINALAFAEAELTNDAGWAEAMKGCKYVLSVASPVFFHQPKNEEEAIRPALEGTRRVLKFAKQASVKRVVMTSNFGAVGFSQTDKNRLTTEEDWTDTNLRGLSVYEKSKTLAERAAWEFIKREGAGLEFATINPVAILGPSLNGHVSGSFHIISNMFDGSMKAIPDIPLNIVDVRDVAELHIRAMITPAANGQRFIATADGQISMPEIATFTKANRPAIAGKIPNKVIPAWVIKLASLFNARASEGAVFIRMNRNVSNAKAKNILGWQPRATLEEAILAAVDSMAQYGIIK
ncbi:SDR family oxidoreductase [Mucilaginibacter pedocola]|uniref:3-beta hydroxysteroid dehydrogenase n=1 Tax=Mucilaginibacter pedocola TaxID=1792845 RepID=A0A1S9PHM8_9SPHI|nr:aldehyde reductase [Mucilaginibacter pedocola]OOQ60464.1 3-beta hydroxysteroid dehydrogenase [Mucilaginibacter pedocola]